MAAVHTIEDTRLAVPHRLHTGWLDHSLSMVGQQQLMAIENATSH